MKQYNSVNAWSMIAIILASVLPACPSGKAADLAVDVAKLEHPYILFHKADIPRLAKRIQTPPYKYIWDNLTQSPPAKTEGVVNAFIYAVTSDLERGQAARKTLADLCALPSWGRQAKLEVAGKCEPAGLIYDMIYDLLTPAERKEFSEKIAKAGIIRLYDDTFDAWWSKRRQHNYSPVFNSAYGLAAMAVLKEKPEALEWVDRAASRVQLFLRSQDPDGGFGEGVNYWCMSMRSIFPFMDGLRNIFGRDLYTEPYLTDATGFFVLYSLSPDRRSTLNFNDAGINRKYDAHVMVRLASACHWPQIAWLVAHDIAGTEDGTIEFDWPGVAPQAPDAKPRKFGLGDIYSFLWYDPQAASAPLDQLPRSRYFSGIGRTIMRSGWDVNAVQLAIISAPKFFGNHEHADRGSIILNAYGERLICDAGKPWTYDDPIIEEWFRGSDGHSVLFVNGQGQTSQEKLSAPGRMSRFVSTPNFDYVLTENAGPYEGRVTRWDRHAIFAVPEFVILFDRVEMPHPAALEFRYHSPGSRNILLQGDAAIFPGDNQATLPSIGRGEAMAAKQFGPKYEDTDWWKTGNPLPQITDWTNDEKQTADLLLQSFCLARPQCKVLSGYQDYRMPATYLAQSYQNLDKADIITILYPRSAQMKQQQQVPKITDLSDGNSLALKVVRGQSQYLIAARGKSGKASVKELSANADLAVVTLAADGSPLGCLMVNGTQLTYGADTALNVDLPLLAVASFDANQARITFDATAPSGADLRIKMPREPVAVSINGKNTFASLTPRNKLAEFHIPAGRTEVIITCKNKENTKAPNR